MENLDMCGKIKKLKIFINVTVFYMTFPANKFKYAFIKMAFTWYERAGFFFSFCGLYGQFYFNTKCACFLHLSHNTQTNVRKSALDAVNHNFKDYIFTINNKNLTKNGYCSR